MDYQTLNLKKRHEFYSIGALLRRCDNSYNLNFIEMR
jgi:hypothetical protein